jgi:phosphoribosylglycinamide formyltransferase 1
VVASPPPNSTAPIAIGVLVSGRGTILEAILAAGLPVSLVVADRPCRGLDIAEDAGLAASLVDRAAYGGFGSGFDRLAYTRAVVEVLADHHIDVVVMAGFGTVLDQPIHTAFPGRVLNTHPSRLPDFPGWHAVEDALAAGVSETGTTVHVATLAMDAGPILAQQPVPVFPDDTVATLHERIKAVERQLYPATIRAFIDKLAVRVGGERGSPLEVEK